MLKSFCKEACLPPPSKVDVKQTMKDLGEGGLLSFSKVQELVEGILEAQLELMRKDDKEED